MRILIDHRVTLRICFFWSERGGRRRFSGWVRCLYRRNEQRTLWERISIETDGCKEKRKSVVKDEEKEGEDRIAKFKKHLSVHAQSVSVCSRIEKQGHGSPLYRYECVRCTYVRLTIIGSHSICMKLQEGKEGIERVWKDVGSYKKGWKYR